MAATDGKQERPFLWWKRYQYPPLVNVPRSSDQQAVILPRVSPGRFREPLRFFLIVGFRRVNAPLNTSPTSKYIQNYTLTTVNPPTHRRLRFTDISTKREPLFNLTIDFKARAWRRVIIFPGYIGGSFRDKATGRYS